MNQNLWQLNQRDYNDKIGESKWTIAQKGCVITSLCAIGQWYLHAFNLKSNSYLMPHIIAKQLKFTPDGLLLWNSINTSDLPFKFAYRYYTQDDTILKNILSSKSGACIVQVNDGAHWCALIGYSRFKGYKLFDPYYGDVVWLKDRYPNKINGFAAVVLK